MMKTDQLVCKFLRRLASQNELVEGVYNHFFVSPVLHAKAKVLATVLASIQFITFHMCSHVGVCVSLIFIVVGTEVTTKPHTVMLSDMSVQVSQIFEGMTTVFMHTG